MTVAQAIHKHIESLPDVALQEVLDFVEFLESKHAMANTDRSWSSFSLTNAMRGLEEEESPYTLSDIREDKA